jgi:hypothetical protein
MAKPLDTGSIRKRIFVLSRELLAILFWTYIIVKLFFVDIDVYLLKTYYPTAVWILSYKFFIILAIVEILFLSIGIK